MSFRKTAVFRVLVILIIFIFIAFISIQVGLTFFLTPKFKNYLEKEVIKQSRGEYHINIKKLSINVFNKSIRIGGFTLVSEKNINSGSPKVFFAAKNINLINFQLFPFLFKKDLIIQSVQVKDATGSLFRNKSKSNFESHKKFSFYHLIKRYLNSVSIKRAVIENAGIRIYSENQKTTPILSSNNNQLRIANLKIDKFIDQQGRNFQADSLKLVIENISYATHNHLYTFKINKLTASYTESKLSLDSVKLIPNYSIREFSVKAGHQTDRIVLIVPHMVFNRLKVRMFIESDQFLAKSLTLKYPTISIFRDKNQIREDNPRKSLQQILKDIPVHTRIDSIHLNKAKVIYEELNKGSNQPGIVWFNNIDALITGLTNSQHPSYVFMNMHATLQVMDKGKMQITYRFPLNTIETEFDCSGKLIDFPLTAVNPMVENVTKFSIRNGIADSMVFAFHANELVAQGWMKLVYHHLRIEILSKKKKSGMVQEFLSLLAQGLFIKENNPSRHKPIRVTAIHYKHDPTRFMLHYTWKALLSGIKPAIEERIINK